MKKKSLKRDYMIGVNLLPILENIAFSYDEHRVSYSELTKYLISQCDKIAQNDWISLPDGTTFEKTFQPRKKKA